MSLLTLPFLLALLSPYGSASSGGVKRYSCGDLVPRHGSFAPRRGQGPFRIAAEPTATPDIRVTISSSTSAAFMGFMVQGRSAAGGRAGAFVAHGATAKTMTCSGRNDTATHNNRATVQTEELVWRPAPGFSGPVRFVGTVLESFGVFFSGVASNEVTV